TSLPRFPMPQQARFTLSVDPEKSRRAGSEEMAAVATAPLRKVRRRREGGVDDGRDMVVMSVRTGALDEESVFLEGIPPRKGAEFDQDSREPRPSQARSAANPSSARESSQPRTVFRAIPPSMKTE